MLRTYLRRQALPNRYEARKKAANVCRPLRTTNGERGACVGEGQVTRPAASGAQVNAGGLGAASEANRGARAGRTTDTTSMGSARDAASSVSRDASSRVLRHERTVFFRRMRLESWGLAFLSLGLTLVFCGRRLAKRGLYFRFPYPEIRTRARKLTLVFCGGR